MYNLEGPTEHAKLSYPKAPVHAAHPLRNEKNHEKLLTYLKQRLKKAKDARDGELNRWVGIDKNVAGWMALSQDDKARQAKQDATGIPQAKEMNLPLSFVHLDDMMTYFAQTFAPNRGMFYHTGNPAEVDSATQIVTIMNNHAVYAGYYREVIQAIYSLLKYNRGGFHMFWEKDEGPKIEGTETTAANVVTELKWQGNKVEAIDLYNFLPDPMVSPLRLHLDGEFAATVKIRSRYWLQNAASKGVLFNCEECFEETPEQSKYCYYRSPPREAKLAVSGNGQPTDWTSVLSMADSHGMTEGYELVQMYCRIDPTMFGLIAGSAAETKARKRYEVWRFQILNDEYICDATFMNNVHGQLPYYMGILNDDLMSTAQKSTAEILTPLQDFASFLLNTHVKATRKNIWGGIVYDPTMVDLAEIPEGEVSWRVPMKATAWGRDVRTGLWEHGGTLDTKQTLQDLDAVMTIINQFFPTQSLPSQIANIDRAVESQVAAVQQGANRRQHKAARLLDDSMFRNLRFGLYYNIIQYQPNDAQVMDFFTGKPITVDLSKLRQTDLPFIIGQGLKSLDRAASAAALQNIIFALIQAPQAAAGIDLLGLIDYWTSMIDIDIDMNQFRLPPAPVGPDGKPLTPEEQAAAQAANEGGAAQGGAPIQPATAPAKIAGGPIYR